MRFVVLRHEMPPNAKRPSHWDFMLEVHGRLRTWALEQEPRTGSTIQALRLPNHRLDYLTIEGPISGDRGCVTRIDRGEFTTLDESEDALRVVLDGERLRGEVRIERDRHDAQRWTFEFASG
jgi:hypothetical protein